MEGIINSRFFPHGNLDCLIHSLLVRHQNASCLQPPLPDPFSALPRQSSERRSKVIVSTLASPYMARPPARVGRAGRAVQEFLARDARSKAKMRLARSSLAGSERCSGR